MYIFLNKSYQNKTYL